MTDETRQTHGPAGDIARAIARAVADHGAGRLAEAEAAYREILESVPDHAGVLHNLGVVVAQSGRPEPALELFGRALAARPDYADAHLNKGGALRALGQLTEALASYDRCLDLRPDQAEAHCGRADVLQRLGRLEDAAESYAAALASRPDHYRAHFGRALASGALGRRAEALVHFRRTMELRRAGAPRAFASRVKLCHDIEQLRHLAARVADGPYADLAETYETLEREIRWPADETETVALSDRQFARVADSYGLPVHLAEAPESAASPLGDGLDAAAVTRAYFDNAPGIAWFDGLLGADALDTLRRYLLESTIWYDFGHVGGYVAAYLEDGLACPLLLRIADDLCRGFPEIFGGHALAQAWAFKCVDGRSAVDVHADAAAVSVNFWITPDGANRDPDAGGLVVHRALPPAGWRIEDYDGDIASIRRFLVDNDAGRVVVPYGENRAVLFDSRLFHESGRVDFRPGYENHRINLTLLFGDRDE